MSSRVIIGDCRAVLTTLEAGSVQTCVTSPPYWGLRDYGHAGQIGLEPTPAEYVAEMVAVFREVRRVLRDDGTLWLNLGDSYASSGGATPGKRSEGIGQAEVGEGLRRPTRKGSGRADGIVTGERPRNRDGAPPCDLPAKNLVGIPWRVAFALQADGWYLRSDIIWSKPNPMPESVTDRPTKAHEYIFLMSKSKKYYYDHEAIQEDSADIGKTKIRFGGNKYGDSDDPKHATKSGNEYTDNGKKNRRSVWLIATQPYKEAHFATFPEVLPRLCIAAGSRPGDIILDPFGGSGTTGKVALELGRKIVHVDIGYHDLAIKRMGLNAS